MRLNKLFFVAGALLILVATAVTSCRTKGDTLVKVIVMNSQTNTIVAGASVTLEATPSSGQPPKEPSALFPMVSTSNSSGEALFNLNEVYQLGQAGVAILDIVVTSGAGNGAGVIKVEQETTSKETVFI
tara:strand:+ start:4652 stop:5038 length:387 start_codon:yes stop_codon:yes gene_type:complete